jgi:hypothetical protein
MNGSHRGKSKTIPATGAVYLFQRFWVDGAAGNGRADVLFNQLANSRVDNGMKK